MEILVEIKKIPDDDWLNIKEKIEILLDENHLEWTIINKIGMK